MRNTARQLAANSPNPPSTPTRLLGLTVFFVSGLLAANFAAADNLSSAAEDRYRADIAACKKGQPDQDRTACVKEARAVRAESRKAAGNGTTDGVDTYTQNALVRCHALPPSDRDACCRRVAGEGTSSGAVSQGGVLRELVVPDKQ